MSRDSAKVWSSLFVSILPLRPCERTVPKILLGMLTLLIAQWLPIRWILYKKH